MLRFEVFREQAVDLQQALACQLELVTFNGQISGSLLISKRRGKFFLNSDVLFFIDAAKIHTAFL